MKLSDTDGGDGNGEGDGDGDGDGIIYRTLSKTPAFDKSIPEFTNLSMYKATRARTVSLIYPESQSMGVVTLTVMGMGMVMEMVMVMMVLAMVIYKSRKEKLGGNPSFIVSEVIL